MAIVAPKLTAIPRTIASITDSYIIKPIPIAKIEPNKK